MTQYPTDLTEKQWQVIKNILEPQARNRKHPLKEIMNAILYINKTGCQWRMLPSDFAPWQTVYYVHPNFKYCPNAGLWNALSHGWKTSEG